MIDSEQFGEIVKTVSQRVGAAECRYCLLVWCDDAEQLNFIGGNDPDPARVLKMLALGGTAVENMNAIEAGHA